MASEITHENVLETLGSNMIHIILPWKFIVFGGGRLFPSKANAAIYYNLLALTVFLVVASLLNELKKARKDNKKAFVRAAVHKWWISYENFIYPLLVLI